MIGACRTLGHHCRYQLSLRAGRNLSSQGVLAAGLSDSQWVPVACDRPCPPARKSRLRERDSACPASESSGTSGVVAPAWPLTSPHQMCPTWASAEPRQPEFGLCAQPPLALVTAQTFTHLKEQMCGFFLFLGKGISESWRNLKVPAACLGIYKGTLSFSLYLQVDSSPTCRRSKTLVQSLQKCKKTVNWKEIIVQFPYWGVLQ